MSSLNEGFELDEELNIQNEQTKASTTVDAANVKIVRPSEFSDVIFENPEIGETPKLDDDVALVAVTGKVQDLNYLRADIIKSNGMDKTFALEAERLMPGFIGEHQPIGFFTDFPTKTNYKLALEAIDAERKTLVKQIWDALVRFMKQAVEWAEQFAEKISNFAGKAKKTQEFFSNSVTESKLDQAQKSFTDPKNTVSKVDMLIKDKQSETFQEYKKVLEQKLAEGRPRLEKLYEVINSNDAIYAVVSRNTAVKALLDIGEKADDIVAGYGAINHRWLEFTLLDNKDADEVKRNAEYAINRIREPAVKMGYLSFDDYAQPLKVSLKQRTTQYSMKNMPLSRMFTTFTVTFKSRKMDSFKEVIDKAVIGLKAVQKTVFDFTSDPKRMSKGQDADTANQMSEAIRALHTELRAVLLLLKFSGDILAAWIWMGEALSTSVDDHRRRVMMHTQDLPEADRKKLREYFGIKEEEKGSWSATAGT